MVEKINETHQFFLAIENDTLLGYHFCKIEPEAESGYVDFIGPDSSARGRGIGADLPFAGDDVWNAYELTWLDPRGKPAVAIASFTVPATSPAIVESKSVKLYLGSFAQSRFADAGAVADAIGRDIGGALGAPVRVHLVAPEGFLRQSLAPLAGWTLNTTAATSTNTSY